MKKLYALPALVLMLIACASAGLAPATTFTDKLAYAYGLHTAVLQATTAGVLNSSVTPADAEAILKQSDTAQGLLDAARLANGVGDLTTATNKLALAVAALQALQTYLTAHSTGGH